MNPLADILVLKEADSIRRDADGVPVAFRVLRAGEQTLTKEGQRYVLNMEPEHLANVVAMAEKRGNKIPVDAEHYLKAAADLYGVEDEGTFNIEKLLGENAAAGLVSLRLEDDGIWADVQKWAGRARELLSGKGTELYAYFSPVLRGIRADKPYISSIALTNVPALENLDVLAATLSGATAAPEEKERRRAMEWLKKLAAAAGLGDAVELSDAPECAERIGTAAAKRLGALSAEREQFLSAVRPAIELGDDATLNDAAGKILPAIEAGKASALALTEAETKLAGFEAASKKRLIADLKAEGKLTEAMSPWAEAQDVAALTEWAKVAPILVPQGRKVQATDRAEDADVVTMSESLVNMARSCGLDPAFVAQVNGLKYEPQGAAQ